jgi:phosphoglycerate dehydrogenase-like enzyme
LRPPVSLTSIPKSSFRRTVARLFSALGCTILAYTASPRPTPASRQDHGYIVDGTGDPSGTIPTAWFSGTTKTDLHVFLSQHLDILVISLPLTTSTTNLFSTDEFEQLSAHPNTTTGQKCFLINIARGRIIDQPALVSALNEGLLRGAALDVAVPEPLPKEDLLWDAKNVIITPHISALGVEYQTRAFDVLMTNLARRQKGQKMFNLVDRKKGY